MNVGKQYDKAYSEWNRNMTKTDSLNKSWNYNFQNKNKSCIHFMISFNS